MRFKSHHRITFFFTLIIAVILTGVYSYLKHRLTERSFERINQELASKTVLVRRLLEETRRDIGRMNQADALADRIGEELGLRVTIIRDDGVVIGDSELNGEQLREVENHLYRKEVQEALAKGMGRSRRFSTTIRQDMLYLGVPFASEGVKGVVRLSIPLTEIELISSGLKHLLVVSLLTAFLIAILVTFLATALITQPIKKISDVAKKIAAGDFSHRLFINRRDEIGELAVAVNHMSEQIKARIDEVMSAKTRLEAVLQSMSEGLMVLDSKNHIILMNESLKRLFHIDYDPSGQSPLEVVRNVDLADIIQSSQDTPGEVVSREVRVLIPEEKDIWIHATPVIREGVSEGLVLVFHDITELRRLEKVRKDFVANVSHELRTPVASIKGYAETLLEGALKDKKNAREFVEIIDKDAQRLARLIDDLLDLSKIESGKLKLDFLSCEAEPIVDRILQAVRKKAEEKALTVAKDIPDDLPKIRADELSVAQALLNLIENAIKYNVEGGRVTVKVRAEADKVRFSVIDTGPGIDAEHLPRIFERFYRVDKARSRELGGTGLGLSIVKHLVQEHHGEVSVESQPGRGSVFSFTIPRA